MKKVIFEGTRTEDKNYYWVKDNAGFERSIMSIFSDVVPGTPITITADLPEPVANLNVKSCRRCHLAIYQEAAAKGICGDCEAREAAEVKPTPEPASAGGLICSKCFLPFCLGNEVCPACATEPAVEREIVVPDTVKWSESKCYQGRYELVVQTEHGLIAIASVSPNHVRLFEKSQEYCGNILENQRRVLEALANANNGTGSYGVRWKPWELPEYKQYFLTSKRQLNDNKWDCYSYNQEYAMNMIKRYKANKTPYRIYGLNADGKLVEIPGEGK